MRNAVSLGIRKMTTAITKVKLQNKQAWGMDHWSSALIKHKFTAWHNPCLCQVPYAKRTVIKSSGIALPKGLLKLSPGMEKMAAGQIPSLGKALQHYSTKLCTLKHFHGPPRHTPAHATHPCSFMLWKQLQYSAPHTAANTWNSKNTKWLYVRTTRDPMETFAR